LVEQRFRKARAVGSIPSAGFSSMPHFSKVFRNRNFILLWAGQIISQLGDRLSQMALIGLVYAKAPGSSMQIAKILSFTIIPVFIIGPFAGVYVDRWNRRTTMYICDLLRTLLVLCIPLFLFDSSRFIWIYMIIFCTFSIGRFFVPAKLSIIPQLVNKEDLLMANSLINTTGMIAAVIGFGVSGLIVEWFGAQSGFYLDSASFFISALLIFLISMKKNGHHFDLKEVSEVSKQIITTIRKSVFQDIREGLSYFFADKNLRHIASLTFLLWSALGAVYVVIIVFIQRTLGSATKDVGLLIMFLGIGLFLGSLVYGRFGQKISQFKIIFISLIISGIMIVFFVVGITAYPVFALAACLATLLGATIAPIMIASNTVIHQVSADHMLGKIFSSLEIVMHLAFLIFMFVSSLLAEHFPAGTILMVTGAIVCVAGCIYAFFTPEPTWSK
jgi:MFS transporter, DHA3 family, macrolide efflux protein